MTAEDFIMKTSQLIMLLGAAAMAGCATTPNWDEHFGEASAQAKAAQTRNPGVQHPAPDGMDGQAAKSTIDNYEKSFSNPTQSGGASGIDFGMGM
jgi:hypothetical protein